MNYLLAASAVQLVRVSMAVRVPAVRYRRSVSCAFAYVCAFSWAVPPDQCLVLLGSG
jgi:hypothetical protein